MVRRVTFMIFSWIWHPDVLNCYNNNHHHHHRRHHNNNNNNNNYYYYYIEDLSIDRCFTDQMPSFPTHMACVKTLKF